MVERLAGKTAAKKAPRLTIPMIKLLNRKIFISVLFQGPCLLGVVSLRYLPLELYPNTELPMLLIRVATPHRR